MLTLLISLLCIQSTCCYLQFWNPVGEVYPAVPQMFNQMQPSPMFYPSPMAYPPQMQAPIFRQQNILPPPTVPEQTTFTLPNNIQQVLPTTTPNTFLSIFDALATILQRELQKSQMERLNNMLPSEHKQDWKQSSLNSGNDIAYADDLDNMEFPNQYNYNTGLANLMNSMPAPDIIAFMNQQHARKQQRQASLTRKSFKIEKENIPSIPPSTMIKKNVEEIIDDDSLIGLLRSGRWKEIDWKRKILGLDEIPTAEEGNALAQMFSEIGNMKTTTPTL